MSTGAGFSQATDEEKKEIERLLYTTGRTFVQISRVAGRSVELVSQVNKGRLVRIRIDSHNWIMNPDYIPPDPKWRKYVPYEE